MSVVDPIHLGALTLTPVHFTGTDVAVSLVWHKAPDVVPGEEEPDTTPVPVAVSDENGHTTSPVLPIPVWETLQDAAVKLLGYEALIAQGITPPTDEGTPPA